MRRGGTPRPTEFKGSLTEQFVQQELRVTAGLEPFTWAPSDSTSEIDFLAETGRGVVPIEAKAERNLRAKSLGVYRVKFSPPLAVRTSLADVRRTLTDLSTCRSMRWRRHSALITTI